MKIPFSLYNSPAKRVSGKSCGQISEKGSGSSFTAGVSLPVAVWSALGGNWQKTGSAPHSFHISFAKFVSRGSVI